MREVYDRKQLQGFDNTKVECIASTSDGGKMFVGTSDGQIGHYTCYHQGSSNKGYYGCQKGYQTKEKKAILLLKVIESWGVVMCISDGYLMVFDLDTLQPLNPMPETKGANLFCVNERLSLLCVGIRHKFKLFSWQAGVKGVLVGSLASGFTLKKEFASPESPRALICTSGCIIVGYKKHYDAIDVQSYTSTRLVDFDREHKLISLEVPATSLRKVPVVILSVGIQGVLVDVFGSGVVSNDERLEWSNVPISAHIGSTFIISMVQGDVIEIHDVGSLQSLQKLKCGGSSSPLTGLCVLDIGAGGVGGAAADSVVSAGGTAYITTPDTVQILEMIPLHIQVTRLVEKGELEDALSICHVNKGNTSLFEEIDLSSIHEKFGSVLYQKGDFDGAVDNYLAADSDIMDVFALFPDLIPPTVACLVPALSKKADSRGKQIILGVTVPGQGSNHHRLTGAILHRAASAIVNYCEKKRPQVTAEAEQAEYRSKISLSSSLSGSYVGGSGNGSDSGSNSKAALMELLAEKPENIVPGSPQDFIRRAVLLDTVLVCSLVSSSPLSTTRRQAVIDVLANPKGNRCHIESCAVLLASQGNAFTEALLWLYRSHNEHKRVLSALTEDRCVGSGAWTREDFYEWMASYLQWMWLGGPSSSDTGSTSANTGGRESSDDFTGRSSTSNAAGGNSGGSSLESMVLPTLISLFQYDAVLGMSVLTGIRQPLLPELNSTAVLNHSFVDSSASRGDVTFRDVISYLQGISTPGSELTKGKQGGWTFSSDGFCPMADFPLPLANGHALSVAYAEWAVDQLIRGNSNSGASARPIKTATTSAIGGSIGGSLNGKSTVSDVAEEYAQLLMNALRAFLEGEDKNEVICDINHSKNDLSVQKSDPVDVKLFKIYRSKLQSFLQCDMYEYRPERMMKYLPQGLLHEYALLLSRLGSHDDVLTIYIHQLEEPDAAEAYCDRMYAQSLKRNQKSGSQVFNNSNSTNVYLSLIKAKLNLAVRSTSTTFGKDPISAMDALRQALEVAEKYYDKVDPNSVLDLLPPKSPVYMVRY